MEHGLAAEWVESQESGSEPRQCLPAGAVSTMEERPERDLVPEF